MQAVPLLVMLLSLPSWGQTPLGVWKLQAAKSRLEGKPPKLLTVRYEARGEGEIWTFYVVRANGSSETTSQTLQFDSKDHACGDVGLEERPDTVASKRLDARTAEVSYKVSGRVARRVLRTVSEDGRQVTLEIRTSPGSAGPAEQKWVFER